MNIDTVTFHFQSIPVTSEPGGVLPIMAYGEAPPERGTFFRLQV